MKIEYKKKIKLGYCYTSSHKIFLDTFLGSIKDDFELMPYYKDNGVYGDIEFGGKDFQNGIDHKIDSIIKSIERCSEPFIFSDIDIVFLKSFYKTFLSLINTDYDILGYKDENGWMTSAFMIIRPSKKTLSAYKDIYKRHEINPTEGDDVALQNKDYNLSIGHIPNMILGGEERLEKITADTLIYHGSSLNSLSKIDLLKRALKI